MLIICMLIASGNTAWADELPKAPAPTELAWSSEIPGNVLWEPVDEAEGEYRLSIYKNGEKVDGTRLYNWFRGEFDSSRRINESGTYKFSMVSIGDGMQYADSDEMFCDQEYTYIRPGTSLGITSNLVWEGDGAGTVSWDPLAGAGSYGAALYYKTSDSGGWQHRVTTYTKRTTTEFSSDIHRYMDQEGLYRFTVTAYSSNIEEIANGIESAPSEIFDAGELVRTISEQLDAILQASPSNARDYLANEIDTEELALAMQASKDVRDKIAFIEKKYKEEENIIFKTNTVNMQFDGDISVIGACLNVNDENEKDPSLASGSNVVSMNFRKAEPNEDYIDASTYGNAIAMDISLMINSEEVEKLDIPITIKIPVPDDIKPSRLIIIHEKLEGNERIRPLITYENGKAYAIFTVTEFSVFVFAELVGNEGGSVEEDGGTIIEDNGNQGNSGSSSSGGSSFSGSSSSSSYTWKQDEKGWWLEAKDGSYPKSAWQKVNGSWYYFDEIGYMTIGWQMVAGGWYYMQPSGAMISNDWILHNGKWYFLNSDGSMATGWVKWNDTWYYLDLNNGAMLTEALTPDGYRVDSAGVWIK